jgi:hypothetical protein
VPIEELESELERQRRISLSEREALVEEHAASLRRLELQFESREAEFEAARWVTHSPHTQPTSQPASRLLLGLLGCLRSSGQLLRRCYTHLPSPCGTTTPTRLCAAIHTFPPHVVLLLLLVCALRR